MTDVAIIGAGVIGCSIGLELARRGVDVTVVDRNGEAGHGSTSASCGIVRRFYSTETMTGMAHEGAALWADWAAHLDLPNDGQLAKFERPGMLFFPPKVDRAIEDIVAHMHRLGVPVELLSADEVGTRFPYINTQSHWPIRRPADDDFFEETGRQLAGAIFEPDAGYVVSPLLATSNLRAAGDKAGVKFMLARNVTAIEAATGAARYRLDFEHGPSLDARCLVNAAGPHSSVVNRLAGVTLPIETRALRREVCAIENPIYGRTDVPTVPVVGDMDSGVYGRPESGGRDLIVGSLDPECDTLEWVDDPDSWNDACSVAGFERQAMRFMKRLPDMQLGGRRGIAGLYDVTLLDWNPILDCTDRAGYYVAIGTSGSSFKTAPVIGAVMAEFIEARENGLDHDHEPFKIKLARTGYELDLSFFSRLRGAHASTGTVLG